MTLRNYFYTTFTVTIGPTIQLLTLVTLVLLVVCTFGNSVHYDTTTLLTPKRTHHRVLPYLIRSPCVPLLHSPTRSLLSSYLTFYPSIQIHHSQSVSTYVHTYIRTYLFYFTLPSYLLWYYSLTRFFFAIFSPKFLSSLSIPTNHHSISAYRQHPNIETSKHRNLRKKPFPPHKSLPLHTNHTIPHIPAPHTLRPGDLVSYLSLPSVCCTCPTFTPLNPPPETCASLTAAPR